MSENPYQTPQDLSSSAIIPDSISNAEEIRRAHIKHEASVKSIGLLYYLSSLGILAIAYMSPVSRETGILTITTPIFLVVLAGFQIITAYHLRKFKPWARIAAIALSAIGLIGFPIGTLINGYFLYLLLSKKGTMIFSPEYKEIIAATPHVKYKTSIAVWVLLGIVIVGLIAIAIGLRA